MAPSAPPIPTPMHNTTEFEAHAYPADHGSDKKRLHRLHARSTSGIEVHDAMNVSQPC